LIRNEIIILIQKAIRAAQECSEFPLFSIPEIAIEHPRRATYGDYATSMPLQLANLTRLAPLKIAEVILKHLAKVDFLTKVEVAPPGFINFKLSNQWLAQQVETILASGDTYGDINMGQGRKVQVEYGSANPTGPLHVGFGRNMVIGDALANVLAAASYNVQREYYVNDTGTQMRLFSESLYARYAQILGRDELLPENGYQGHYVVELAQKIVQTVGDRFLLMPRQEAITALGEVGLHKVLVAAQEDIELMGIHYDNFFSERSLYEDGTFDKVVAILQERGYMTERDEAVWFTSSELGEDKDNVIIRSDGSPGYFASDIAYHYNKFVERGFDWVIDVWGADHQGHVPRMKAMMRALGLDPERLTLLVYQLVTLKRGGEVVRLSKRTGDIITLREVIEDVGSDAVRFFLLARAADSQMDFDLDLAVEQSNENPVYYVQYGHARIASILRYAQERVPDPSTTLRTSFADGDVSLLRHPAELALIRQMLLLPEVVEQAAENLAPHHLTYYAQDLASAFHSFYKECRVVSSDPADAELNKARLKLVSAAKIVLAKTLRLMGMTAPERM
jgi:arginyl-tRNA synthetase